MSWIESHQGIERHPKTMKLSVLMGWDIDQTIGKLHRLWWWCLDFAPDGNVSRHSADMAALAVGLSADMGEKFISALYDAEFLDKTSKKQYLIHDWLEYAGRYLRDTKFRRNPEKLKEIIELHSTIVSRQSADKKPTIRRKSAVPDLPNLTLPNHIKHKHGEYKHVLLTNEQYQKLQERFGDKRAYWIKKLDEGIQQKGYEYKDHYLTILKWSEKEEGNNGQGTGNNKGGPGGTRKETCRDKAEPGKYAGIGEELDCA